MKEREEKKEYRITLQDRGTLFGEAGNEKSHAGLGWGLSLLPHCHFYYSIHCHLSQIKLPALLHF